MNLQSQATAQSKGGSAFISSQYARLSCNVHWWSTRNTRVQRVLLDNAMAHQRHSRNAKLSPAEREIAWSLLEVGFENFAALMNEVLKKGGGTDCSPESLAAAMENLVRKGYCEIVTYVGPGRYNLLKDMSSPAGAAELVLSHVEIERSGFAPPRVRLAAGVDSLLRLTELGRAMLRD